jgi:hypothetical protein
MINGSSDPTSPYDYNIGSFLTGQNAIINFTHVVVPYMPFMQATWKVVGAGMRR